MNKSKTLVSRDFARRIKRACHFSRQLAALLLALLLAPAPAFADMLSSVREQTLGCGTDFFFFSRDGSLLWSYYDDARTKVPLLNEAIVENSAERLILRVKPPGSEPSAKTLTFLHGEKGYRVLIDGDTQDCAASSGMQMMIDSWHDAVRENACGNDPMPACEKELIRLCGKPAKAECARRHKARLDLVSAQARGRTKRR